MTYEQYIASLNGILPAPIQEGPYGGQLSPAQIRSPLSDIYSRGQRVGLPASNLPDTSYSVNGQPVAAADVGQAVAALPTQTTTITTTPTAWTTPVFPATQGTGQDDIFARTIGSNASNLGGLLGSKSAYGNPFKK